jgi:hypothetical protein
MLRFAQHDPKRRLHCLEEVQRCFAALSMTWKRNRLNCVFTYFAELRRLAAKPEFRS